MTGLQQKLRNNFALASLVFSRAVAEHAADVMPICLLLPLHHMLRDVAHVQRMETAFTHATRISHSPDLQSIRARLVPYWTPAMDSLWEQCADGHAPQELLDTCATLYTHLLHAAQQAAPDVIKIPAQSCIMDNPWATTDAQWSTLCADAVAHAAEIFQLVPAHTHALHDDVTFPVLAAGTGLLTYRQRLFPEPLQIWNCRALTSALAEQGKALLWTETFQGSTAIVYR